MFVFILSTDDNKDKYCYIPSVGWKGVRHNPIIHFFINPDRFIETNMVAWAGGCGVFVKDCPTPNVDIQGTIPHHLHLSAALIWYTKSNTSHKP